MPNVYQGTEPDVYLINNIYDPDDPARNGAGQTVPAVGSVIIDNISVPGKYVIKLVDAIDGVTLKATLVEQHVVADGVEGGDRIISYGNDTMMLYFDDRSSPARLIVDSKFVLVGSASAKYRLVKVNGTTRTTISLALDNDGDPIGSYVPIIDSGQPGIRKFSECYTTHTLEEGDFVELEIYDTQNVITTTVRLITKRATVANDLIASSNPIVGFSAEANQIAGGDWVIYVNQNPEDLTIFPELTYADGTKERIAVDGNQTLIFGMDEIDTTVPETQYHVIIKHFLPDGVPATIAEGESVKFVSYERFIRIIARGVFTFSKIMPIPVWNPATDSWKLNFVGYYQSRDKFEYLAPSAVQYVGDSFDGDNYSETQTLIINSQTIDGNGDVVSYQQTFAIRLNAPGDEAHATHWTISSSEASEFVYGAQTSEHTRPKLNYDAGRGSYFIPTELFANSGEVIDNFFYQIEPPFLPPGETESPDPTHFIVRDGLNGRVLTSSPVPLASYGQEFSLLSNTGNPAQYNDSTVIVEFLLESGGSYLILFGVPVEVAPSLPC